jgi:hypothetical protein
LCFFLLVAPLASFRLWHAFGEKFSYRSDLNLPLGDVRLARETEMLSFVMSTTSHVPETLSRYGVRYPKVPFASQSSVPNLPPHRSRYHRAGL